MTALVWPPKDPAETLDFDIDWSTRLGADTINASASNPSTWAIVTTDGGNLAIVSSSFTSSRTKVFLTGGTPKFNYVLRNTITTVNGDTEVETAMLPIRSR